jgi:hypothetical protein
MTIGLSTGIETPTTSTLPTKESVLVILRACSRKLGAPAVYELIASATGAKRLSDVSSSEYPALVHACMRVTLRDYTKKHGQAATAELVKAISGAEVVRVIDWEEANAVILAATSNVVVFATRRRIKTFSKSRSTRKRIGERP